MRLPAFACVRSSLTLLACRASEPPGLAAGAAAPEFALPGVDGKTHALRDFSASRVLAIVFTSNSCPAAQQYESRIQALDTDYRGRGVSVVAINANQPGALRLADLAYSDVGDSLEDMKVRAGHRRLTYPYLSDGASQAVTRQFGVVATPQVFVFDQARRLQYRGRLDDNVMRVAGPGPGCATGDRRAPRRTARAGGAHDAGRVPGERACGRRRARTRSSRLSSRRPVSVEMIGTEDLGRLRKNGTGKLLLINFWATWCAPCASEFPDLETTYRMFKPRGLEFVSVSVNDPGERAAVLEFLKAHHASHPNRLFATPDVYGLQAAFDPKMPAPVPFTLLLAPNGDVVYQELGELDTPKLRRAILANLPDDEQHRGQQAYWASPGQ